MKQWLGNDRAAAAEALSRIFGECGVEAALIGATAWMLLVDWKYDLAETITTRDLDFVVGVSSWEEFRHVHERCLASGFARGRAEHELTHPQTGSIVDLVPVGGPLTKGDRLVWPGSGREMNMQGVAEALAGAKAHELVEGVYLRVPPLEMLVALKFMAYGDRPERNDLLHIDHIFRNWPKGDEEFELFDELSPEGIDNFAVCGGAIGLAKRAVDAFPASVIDSLHATASPLADPDCPSISSVLHSLGRAASDERARLLIAERMGAYARRLKGPLA